MLRAACVLALLVLLAACNETDTAPGISQLTTSVRTLDALDVQSEQFAQGELIKIELSVTNPGPDSVVLSFPSSQQFDFRVINSTGDLVWQWSATTSFTPAFTLLEIPAQSTYVERVTWNQATDFSGFPLPNGRYTLEGYFLGVDAIASAELTIQ